MVNHEKYMKDIEVWKILKKDIQEKRPINNRYTYWNINIWKPSELCNTFLKQINVRMESSNVMCENCPLSNHCSVDLTYCISVKNTVGQIHTAFVEKKDDVAVQYIDILIKAMESLRF